MNTNTKPQGRTKLGQSLLKSWQCLILSSYL